MILVGIAALAWTLGSTSDTTSADSIIARYYTAIGGRDRVLAVQTRRMSGTYQEGTFSASTTILGRRPNLRRVSVTGPDGFTFVELFDGTTMWEFSEKFASPVRRDTGAAERAGRRGAEFDESFVDWNAKGHRVEARGRQSIRGRDVDQLHVVLADGWEKDYYFDVASGLLVALRKAMPLHAKGAKIESLSFYEDYRAVNGILLPHAFEERNTATGELMNVLRWTKIELDVPIRDEAFHRPE
jgi:hypothetical protein